MLPCSASQRSPPYTLSPLATRHWKKSLPLRAAAGPPTFVAEPTPAARPVTNCWRLSNSLTVPASQLAVEVTRASPIEFEPCASDAVSSAYESGVVVLVATPATLAQSSTGETSPEVVTDPVEGPERVAPDWMLFETRGGAVGVVVVVGVV